MIRTSIARAFGRVLSSQTLLAAIASVIFLVFNVVSVIIGLQRFNHAMTDGPDYGDFQTFSSRIILNIAYLSLMAIYLIWLFQPKSTPSTFRNILRSVAIFLGLALIGYPYSADIYMYLQYGWMGLNQVNPYLNPAISFDSVLSPILGWPQSSTYGPISQLIFMISAATIPISPIVGVYLFKVFCLLAHIFNGYLIWRFLRLIPNLSSSLPLPSLPSLPSSFLVNGSNDTDSHQDLHDNVPIQSLNRSKLTIAYLINPILLNEFICNAHVDVFLSTTIILMIGWLYQKRFAAAVLVTFAGFLTKTVPVIYLPLLAGFLVQKRRWRALAISGGIILLIVLVLSQTLMPNLTAWRSLANPGVADKVGRSLFHFLYLFVEHILGITSEVDQLALVAMAARLATIGFGVYYLWTLLQPYLNRRYSEVNLVADLGWATLILFLFATPWLMPWYPTTLLPFAFLGVNAPIFFLTSMVFCFSPALIIGAGSGKTALSFLTSLTTVGMPIATLIWAKWFPKRAKVLVDLVTSDTVTNPPPPQLPNLRDKSVIE